MRAWLGGPFEEHRGVLCMPGGWASKAGGVKRVRRSVEDFSAEPGVGVSQQGWAGEQSQPACMALARRTPGPEAGLEASSRAAGSLWSLHKDPGNDSIMCMFQMYFLGWCLLLSESLGHHVLNKLGSFYFLFLFLQWHPFKHGFSLFRKKSWGKVEKQSTSTSMMISMFSLKFLHPQQKPMPGWDMLWKKSKSSSFQLVQCFLIINWHLKVLPLF